MGGGPSVLHCVKKKASRHSKTHVEKIPNKSLASASARLTAEEASLLPRIIVSEKSKAQTPKAVPHLPVSCRATVLSEGKGKDGTLSVKALRSYLLSPKSGKLECIVSGFLKTDDFQHIGVFFSAFHRTIVWEAWYVDPVMLAVLGQVPVQFPPATNGSKTPPARVRMQMLLKKREECSRDLRKRLIDGCRAVQKTSNCSSPHAQLSKKPRRSGEESMTSPTSNDRRLTRVGVSGNSLFDRLPEMVDISFSAYQLIAEAIPVGVLTSLPVKYFTNSVSIMQGAFKHRDHLPTGKDLQPSSYFVSLHDRVRLLQGLPERPETGKPSTLKIEEEVKVWPNKATTIRDSTQLCCAMESLAAVITSACSSLVLYVMAHLSEALKHRRSFCAEKRMTNGLAVSNTAMVAERAAHTKASSGRAMDCIHEWIEDVAMDKLSLTAMAQKLVRKYRDENARSIEAIKNRYTCIFPFLETVASAEEKADFDPTRLLSGIALKLMFLLGGGARSIEADDCRVRLTSLQVPDDVRLSEVLEVPILNRICWFAYMVRMPDMSGDGICRSGKQTNATPLVHADDCTGVLRTLFQAVGALPVGALCPLTIKEWLWHFPFHAVGTEEKRILLYLYIIDQHPIQRLPLRIPKDNVVLAMAQALQECGQFKRDSPQGYLFAPTFTVGNTAASPETVDGSFSWIFEHEAPEVAAAIGTEDSSDARLPQLTIVENGGGGIAKIPGNSNPFFGPTDGTRRGPKGSLHNNGLQARDENCGLTELQKFPLTDRTLSSDVQLLSPSSTDGSCSASSIILPNPGDVNVDIYTCVSPQAQLYLRCAHEAASARRNTVELTPCVKTELISSMSEVQSRYPVVAVGLHAQKMELKANQAVLIVMWDEGEPLVTFNVEDELLASLVPADKSTGKDERDPGASLSCSDTKNIGASSTTFGTVDGRIFDRNYFLEYDLCDGFHELCHGPPNRGGILSQHNARRPHWWSGTRVGVRWTIKGVFPLSTFFFASLHPPDRSSDEVALVVETSDLPMMHSFRVLSLGHRRPSLSVFSGLDGENSSYWFSSRMMSVIRTNALEMHCKGLSYSYFRNTQWNNFHSLSSAFGSEVDPCLSWLALKELFFLTGVLLANAISNGVCLNIPFAPLLFRLLKRSVRLADTSLQSFAFLEPSEGNLLSSACVAQSAYNILTMKTEEYYAYLCERGMHEPDGLLFPVFHSLAQETLAASDLGMICAGESLNYNGKKTKDCPTGVDHPAWGKKIRLTEIISVDKYIAEIASTNRRWPIITRDRRPSSVRGPGSSKMNGLPIGVLDKLPSRQEYVALYMTNELTWGLMGAGGADSESGRQLWACLCKGLEPTPLSKSPLLVNCCSRVVREVLCGQRRT